MKRFAGITVLVSGGVGGMTEVSPGMVATGFTASIRDEATRGAIEAIAKDIAIPADAIARAVAFAIEQPRDVNVSSLAIYPTAQG